MPIDHVGLGVPDVEAATEYYDEFMPLVGFVRQWEAGYRADDWYGAQVFLYPTLEGGDYSRHRIGLQHISFHVATRTDVHRVHQWAKDRDHEIVHEPKLFPEYHEHFYATFFLDMHGFMIETVTYENADGAGEQRIARHRPAVPRDMPAPPGGLPMYRLLTGPDDEEFCRRVSEMIELGYELHGAPALTFNGEFVIAAQAMVWPHRSHVR